MPRAFLLVNTESGKEETVVKQVKPISAIKEAYVCYGVYDLILRVEAETMEELKDIVSHKIRAVDKVRSTLTLIMMDE